MKITSSVNSSVSLEVDGKFDKDMELCIDCTDCGDAFTSDRTVSVYLDVKRATALRDHLSKVLPKGKDVRAEFEEWMANDPTCQSWLMADEMVECLFRAWSVK